MDFVVGDRVRVEVGKPAHGGHCVARHEGIVLFVRHALPGEAVVAEITELHKGYLRADAIEILTASPDRVAAPCPYSGPNLCGGCDLQHASAPAQRAWKTAVVREQLARLGGLPDVEVTVEALPDDGFGWRTRVRYHIDALNRPGLLKHRSNEVVPIDRCLIAHPGIQELDVLQRRWPDADVVDVVAPAEGKAQIVAGQRISEFAVGRRFDLAATAFWQVHPAAADTLAECVLQFLAPKSGETALDLYGGAGLFAAALAAQGCQVTMVEAAGEGVKAARRSLGDAVQVVESSVERAKLPSADLVVLDPPRTGAGARVVRKISALAPRAIAYVACDPAALARDLKTFGEEGWELTNIRAFDCFPQTHHVECVALLVKIV
ncbi:class I SAM-dependent RNA methyltransferase [Rhizocola hellebori]|uniref:class I SAM-dependent RNA methyltransferase n=1 Tax=Rhizocola hellebori TaxID=1392758 RepID=UPI001940595D|nr:TRAM domain-containing protein [Rhizocola hellebori]